VPAPHIGLGCVQGRLSHQLQLAPDPHLFFRGPEAWKAGEPIKVIDQPFPRWAHNVFSFARKSKVHIIANALVLQLAIFAPGDLFYNVDGFIPTGAHALKTGYCKETQPVPARHTTKHRKFGSAVTTVEEVSSCLYRTIYPTLYKDHLRAMVGARKTPNKRCSSPSK
jgi:hypothetical protein